MKYAVKLTLSLSSVALLLSCSAGGQKDIADIGAPSLTSANVQDQPPRLGEPYVVGKTTYTPQDVAAYDDVGYASYYGSEFSGRPTANGEIFNGSGFSAAHKTLPLPTYVEVTALDTGKTILVRVNDRGPFANDRLIDLSEAAARQLGIVEQGVAGVRVRKVNPPEQERAVLRAGSSVTERLETPESLLRILRDRLSKLPKPSGYNPTNLPRSVVPKPIATNSPVPTPSTPAPRQIIREGQPVSALVSTNRGDGRFIREGGIGARATAATNSTEPPAANGSGYVVQLASYSSQGRADDLARKLGATVSLDPSGKLFRVRYGPYATEAEAQRGLETARQRGYSQARLFRE